MQQRPAGRGWRQQLLLLVLVVLLAVAPELADAKKVRRQRTPGCLTDIWFKPF